MARDSDRVADLVSSLTRAEKLQLVRGADDPEGTATGYVPGVDRLGIPELRLVDGPLGVRVPEQPATAFPASIALASTFDPDLARRQGAVMGREATARGQDVLLAPGLNLLRVPYCGRTFEYYSEDPVVTGAIAAAMIEGIQSEDVLATPKHYVANSQEHNRAGVSAELSERALRELYLPGFEAAVEAGAGAVMTAYNRVNGTYMSEHRRLITDVLKQEWGFEGFVVSDWYGTESTVAAANAGLDLEMPGVPPEHMIGAAAGEDHDPDGDGAPSGEADGTVGGGGGADEGGSDGTADGRDDHEVDFEELEQGMPDPTNVGLFGEPLDEAIEAGEVPESRLDDMVARILGGMDSIGRLGAASGDDRGDGALDTPDHRSIATEIATRGTVLLENDGVLPLADDADVALIGPNVHEPTLGGGGSSETTPFEATTTAAGLRERAGGDVTVHQGVPTIEDVSFFDLLAGDAGGDGPAETVDRDAAIAAAEDAAVAVVVVRDRATEAADRDSLGLPGDQDDLVAAVAAANDRTVVAVRSSGPVELPWREDVAAVLASWYPGQADGEALASVLYGDVDAAGRLPVTFAPEHAYPATDPHQYPGVDDRAHYEEGVFVGYRHFDATDAEPTYPFGHGHSYAAFEYRDADLIEDDVVAVTVANVAERDGREVVQAYVRPPADGPVERPRRELGGFAAVEVPAGETRTVELDLDAVAFQRYDDADGWTVDPGEYAVEIGRSSRDLRRSVSVDR